MSLFAPVFSLFALIAHFIKTRAIGRELLRTVMALLMDFAIPIRPNR
jgi:uncharacterized membrane protein (GlpM family)